MAERVKPAQAVPTPAPVAQLVAAWNERSADRLAGAFAPHARVTIPPLHLEFEGHDDVWRAAGALFAAFGALRYTLRHRYLSPDGVTDEALLEGMQTLDFLGAPPPGRPGAVAARLMMTHDGQQITGLTLWPDVAALRELSAGVARRIDLRAAGPAAPVVAALRATIPSPESRFSVGQGRQLTALDEVSTLLPGAPAAAEPGGAAAGGAGEHGGDESRAKGKKDGPKAPMTRRRRRVRAAIAGGVMLVLAGLLVTYVVRGVQTTKDPVVAAAPQSTPVAAPTTAPPTPRPSTAPTPAPSPSATATASFDKARGLYSFPNSVLFEVNKSTLRPEARSALQQVVDALTQDRRYGTVRVFGYTDITGPPAVNLRLSAKRANVVATFLRDRLDGTLFTVVPHGLGATDFIAGNDTPEHRQENRRVEIKVPRANRAAASPSAPAPGQPSASPSLG